MTILLASKHIDYAANNQNLLSVVEMAWNFDQHSNRDFSYYNRFDIMPRVIEQTDETSIQVIIVEMENSRSKIAVNRTSSLL